MTPDEFNNKLTTHEKWDKWKEMIGNWQCPRCHENTDNPERARPFSGVSIHCDNCDTLLTRPTGGGMSDPFNWVLKSSITGVDGLDYVVYFPRDNDWAYFTTEAGAEQAILKRASKGEKVKIFKYVKTVGVQETRTLISHER